MWGLLCPFPWGGAGSPSNTVCPGPRPTCVASFILIRPTTWPVLKGPIRQRRLWEHLFKRRFINGLTYLLYSLLASDEHGHFKTSRSQPFSIQYPEYDDALTPLSEHHNALWTGTTLHLKWLLTSCRQINSQYNCRKVIRLYLWITFCTLKKTYQYCIIITKYLHLHYLWRSYIYRHIGVIIQQDIINWTLSWLSTRWSVYVQLPTEWFSKSHCPL